MVSIRQHARLLQAIAIIAVILLAAGLRFHQLGTQSLWNDEGASIVMARRSLSAILTNAAADIHPPGYYILLAGWTKLAGESEFALRALSALESILTVAVIYALGRRLFGPDAGLIAALLLAVNTFAIYYAQETRMYAQLGLLAAGGMWALVVWLRGRAHTFRPLIALALINAAGLYTQYAYPFTMLAQGVVFLLWWARRRDGRAFGLYTAANLGTLLLFAPWAGEAIRQVTTWPNSTGGTDPGAVFGVLVYGLTARSGVGWLPAFGALIFAAMGLWLSRERPLLLLPPLWTAITAGAFLLLGLQPDDIKQLLPATEAAALWLGAGAAWLWRDNCLTPRTLAIAGSAIMAAALIGGLPPLYNDPAHARSDYRAMAAQVMADPRPDDAIILDGPGQGEVWAYYYHGEAPVYPLPRGLGGDDDATRAEMRRILREHRRIFALFWGEAERDPNRVVESMLDASAFEVETRWYGDVRFVVYAAPEEAATTPTETLDARFGDHIILHGYALDRAIYRPGDVITLTLFWRTDAPLSTRYKVFVHLYADPDAPPPAQHDSEPGSGLAPTITWTPGETITDRHGILIPPDLPPGTYTLAVGMYAADDAGARLTTPQGDRLPLAAVRVSGERP